MATLTTPSVPETEDETILELLQLFYQGLKLICAGLERMIARRKARRD